MNDSLVIPTVRDVKALLRQSGAIERSLQEIADIMGTNKRSIANLENSALQKLITYTMSNANLSQFYPKRQKIDENR